MISKKDTFFSNKAKRFVMILLAFLLFNLMSFLLNPYDSYWRNYFTENLTIKIVDLIVALIFCILISESNIRVSNMLNKRFSWTKSPGKRLTLEISINLIAILVFLFILGYIYDLFFPFSTNPIHITFEEITSLIQWVLVSVIIAFVIIGIQIGDYLIVNWKNTLLKALKLDQAVVEAELHALKLQMDPHFVFNNLSVLSELILQDQKLGYDYAENFTKIYRYMLINSKKDFIPLEDELKFLKSYIFLVQYRVGEGVLFKIKVSNDSLKFHVLPLTTQLLVENALKHNKTQKSNPLIISIFNDSNHNLVVENTLQPIENTINSSGLGLKNIFRRYSLLSSLQPEIIQDNNFFKVTIPLIKI